MLDYRQSRNTICLPAVTKQGVFALFVDKIFTYLRPVPKELPIFLAS
jgi:hypothetical protein